MKSLFTFLFFIFYHSASAINYITPVALNMPMDSVPPSEVTAISGHNSKVYVAVDGNLNIYDAGLWQAINLNPGGINYITKIAFDANDNAWMTATSVLKIVDTNYNVTVLNNQNSSFPFVITQDITVDPANNIWVTGDYSILPTTIYGLTKYDGTNWTVYDSTNTPMTNEAHKVLADHSGNIWLSGTNTGELLMFDGNNWTVFHDTDYNVPNGFVSAMACDNSGIMWFTIYNGATSLVKYNANGFTTVATNSSIFSAPLLFTIDDLGNKWFSYGGASIHKFDGVQIIEYIDTFIYNNFQTITALSAVGNNLWIGTENNYLDKIYALGSNQITGDVFFDANHDGQRQPLEINLPNVMLHVMPEDRYVFSDTAGYSVSLLDTAGSHTVEVIPPPYWSSITLTQNVTQTYAGEITDSVDFDLYADSTFKNVSVVITSWRFRTGGNARTWLNIRNYSLNTITDTVTLLLHPDLTYNSAAPIPDFHSGDTLRWYYSNLLPLETRTFEINSLVSQNAVLGDTITLYAIIQPVNGDTVPTDNFDTLANVVIGSYDPNSKEVSPEGSILPTQELEYVVNFQNTGTDTAFTVMIRDTLSGDLDLATLQIIGYSHPLTYQLYDHTLVFTFSNILLPDSNIDEPNSHGFVKYKIKPNASIANGIIINNAAAIFFDYNLPVITNTVSNMIDYFLSTGNISNDSEIKIYPNPAHNKINILCKHGIQVIEIFNTQGQLIKTLMNNSNQVQLDLENFQPGVYLIKAKGEKTVSVSKFIKQ